MILNRSFFFLMKTFKKYCPFVESILSEIFIDTQRGCCPKMNSLFIWRDSSLFFFFFLFSFIFISWRLITLQYCSDFFPYIDMSQPWIYMCSPS